jgi:uncharacterized protein (TIGR04222 family)
MAVPVEFAAGGAAGDATWGISGPTFLLSYVVIALAVWVASSRARRAIAEPPADRSVADPSAHPYDVAYLNGARELAVCAALGAMHQAGTIVPASKGAVQAVGRPDPGADPLERAIHFTAAGAVPRRRLQFHRPVATALDTIEARLVAGHLLLSTEDRRRYRHVGRWMLAVAGLGLLRLLAGIAEARPVGYLFITFAVVTVIAVVQLGRAPRRSRVGDRVLERLRREHHGLSPEARPDWTVYGPAGAALGVGIFGMSALWASDPVFADEIALQRVGATGGSSDGGSAGWSGSSCGGGSSDGGGGGGGCGGGGCGG